MQKKIHDRNPQPAINKSRTETQEIRGQTCFYFLVLLTTLMQIFLSRSHPAPDMPLRLVRIQHLAGFTGKGRIDLEEPFGDILMYGCR